MIKKYLKMSLMLFLALSFKISAHAESSINEPLKEIVQELKKVRENKSNLVKILEEAEKNHEITGVVLSASVVAFMGTLGYSLFDGAVQFASGFSGEKITSRGFTATFIERNLSKLLVIEGAAIGISTATGIYYKFKAQQLRELVAVLNNDIEVLTKKIISVSENEK